MSLTLQILLLSILSIVMTRHLDFNERFLERKRLRSLKEQTLAFLSNNMLKERSTEVVDGIPHYRQIKGSSSTHWKRIKAIENDFRRLLAMKGSKYDYKRDLFWRTWRSIPPVNGHKHTVSYRCNNLLSYGNVTEIQKCGMWIIEEGPPPCPYEFFSVISDDKLCGADYTQFKYVKHDCPSVIKFSDLTATCDNPIETLWRFTKMYGVQEKHDNVICANKDFCEIFTSYEISPAHVVFRIINSTNDVMYSRIMKPNNQNYICAEDCGRLNPNTRKISKVEKPLRLDLLNVKKPKKEVYRELNISLPVHTTIIPLEDNMSMSMSNIGGN